MNRLSTVALVVLSAVIPLYGTFAALDPARPPIPPLVPHAVTIAIGVIVLAAFVAIIPAAARAARRDTLTLALFAPGTANLLASLAGFDPLSGIGLSVLAYGFGAAGLVFARVADRATIQSCIRALLWSALAAAAIALAMFIAHRPAALYAYNNGRAVGTFLNPNELAAYALVALGAAAPLAIASRGRDRLATVTAALLVLALAATFSRWGALSAVCGIAVYGIVTRSRTILAGALVVAVAGLALNAFAGAGHHNPRDTEARVVAWRTGLTTFERFPLLGVGPLAFSRTYDELRPPEAPGPRTPVAFDPHSVPLAFAADGGLVAVVTVLTTWAFLVSTIVRGARVPSQRTRMLALGLGSAFVAFIFDCSINTISLVFPVTLQVAPMALGVLRSDAS